MSVYRATNSNLGIGRVALSEARDRLLARCERGGHCRAKVELAVRVSPDRAQPEILFSIDGGPAARVTALEFPGNTALEDDALGEAVAQVVRETLREELERPATDPALLTEILAPPSVPPGKWRPAPHAADPDAERFYIERAYRTGADTVADLYRVRRALVFVLVLGFSRHMFAKVVFDQRIETWIRLHIEAFKTLGGVPKVIVPDKLKPAVVRAVRGERSQAQREDASCGSNLGMTRERYRLARQVNGRSAYADVDISVVAVEPGNRRVDVADYAFAWLKEEYGPDAWEWPVCDEYRKAAIDGVNFALDNSMPAVEAAVSIECIRAAPVDSNQETIAFAAAQATWRALNTRPTRTLKIYGVDVPA